MMNDRKAPVETGVVDPQVEQTTPTATSLPTSSILTAAPARLTAVQRCHVGRVRQRNEDNSFTFTSSSGGQMPLLPFGLYIVADGMGGHKDGHEASRQAIRTVAADVLKRIYVPLLNSGDGTPPEPVGDVMLQAVQRANSRIHNPDPEQDGGTTVTAVLIFGRRLFLAHVGDSRAYLAGDSKWQTLTEDHSYVQRLIEAGHLTTAEAAVHPQRNVLYRAVGQGSELEIDTFTQTLPRQGTLIVCSDGLWGLVEEHEMQAVIAGDGSLDEKADDLVELALQAGGHDNITVVLAEFAF